VTMDFLMALPNKSMWQIAVFSGGTR